MCLKESNESRERTSDTIGSQPLISVFVPCLNEEDNIVPSLNTIVATMNEMRFSYEILIYDDHSGDKTVERIKEYQTSHPDIPIHLAVNPRILGLGHNYVEGAFAGKGKHYILVNGDNAESKNELIAILSKLGEADMIIPYFGNRDVRRKRRRFVSAAFTWLMNFISGNKVKYYNGPVLHLRHNILRWHPDTHGFAYQAELITRLIGLGKSYIEVQVANVDRTSGLTKAFSFDNFLSISHSMIRILLNRTRDWMFR